jgi:hypothetical protein
MPCEVATDCCIVIPVYRPDLSAAERASVLNTCQLLGRFPVRIICPKGLDLQAHWQDLLAEISQCCSDIDILVLDPGWFASTATYNSLMLSPSFYRLFLKWQYILIAQIDAWIFSAALAPWLEMHYSYLGAPWRGLPDLPPGMFCPDEAVGNGGLSLRCVRDHYALLTSWRYKCYPVLGVRELFVAHIPLHSFRWNQPIRSLLRLVNRLRLILMRLLSWRNSLAYFSLCGLNEDIIFGLLASRVFPGFRVPGPAVAARFSLDANPDFFYRLYIQPDQLPFGCHAWEKSHALFWRHLRTTLPSSRPSSPRHQC